jgi:hypothetical protein
MSNEAGVALQAGNVGSFLHISTRELWLPFVYCGAVGSGKVTTLRAIRALVPEARFRGERVSTDGDVRLYGFDAVPLHDEIRGSLHRLSLDVAPPSPCAARRDLLRRACGVVLVVDSLPDKLEENRRAFDQLLRDLAEPARDPAIPLVVQYNKRDREDALPVETLRQSLGYAGSDAYESIAASGVGVTAPVHALRRKFITRYR